MVYYLKVNRLIDYTITNLQHWIKTLALMDDATYYILCDNDKLIDEINNKIDFKGTVPRYLKSIKRAEDEELMDRIAVPKWHNAGYAHLTTFIHAKENNIERFWNIDADDTVFCLSYKRLASLLNKVEQYAVINNVDLFSLDMWRSRAEAAGGEHWSFGITYTNNSIDWISVIKKNMYYTTPCRLFRGCMHPKNIDEFFTYIKENEKTVKIETFCFNNLLFLHYSDDFIVNPVSSAVLKWSDGKVVFPILYYIYGCDSLGSIPIAHDVIRMDMDITEQEGRNFLARTAKYSIEVNNVIETDEFKEAFDESFKNQVVNSMNDLMKRTDIRNSRIYLWGCCKYIQPIKDILERENITAIGIFDNDKKKQGKQYDGLPVISPESIREMNEESSIILVAIRFYDEICEQLKSLKYVGKVEKVIDYRKFENE